MVADKLGTEVGTCKVEELVIFSYSFYSPLQNYASMLS